MAPDVRRRRGDRNAPMADMEDPLTGQPAAGDALSAKAARRPEGNGQERRDVELPVDKKQAAAFLGISEDTLDTWTARVRHPPHQVPTCRPTGATAARSST